MILKIVFAWMSFALCGYIWGRRVTIAQGAVWTIRDRWACLGICAVLGPIYLLLLALDNVDWDRPSKW